MLTSVFFALLTASATMVSSSPTRKSLDIVSVPITVSIANKTTTLDIVKADALRKQRFSKNKRQTTVPVTNSVVSYLAPCKFGGSSTTYQLIVDTGSSNTWLGANQPFKCKSPCTSTHKNVSVSYGSGSFSGTEMTDTVTIGSLSVTKQSIGVANQSTGFDGVDGILGVGPVDLTEGTVSGSSQVPTVMQNAYSQGKVPAQILGVYFAPTTTPDNKQNGELAFGGVDTSKTTGSVSYTTAKGPYWGINVPLTIGSKSQNSQTCIVDTGTTLIYLASSAFTAYRKAIPSAVLDTNSGLLRFPKSSLSKVPAISLKVGGTKFNLNSYGQLVEQGLYSAFGLNSTYYYSWVNDGGSGSDVTCIIGQKFLERFYSVYDTTNNRIGFAKTSNSNPTSVP